MTRCNIDVVIVAVRRSELLREMLNSFHRKCFGNFTIANAFLNIDPVWGDESETDKCIALCERFFPDLTVFTPSAASFPGAVRRLWSATKSPFILHLEDDWVLREKMGPEILSLFDDRQTAQLSLLSKEKVWDFEKEGEFHVQKRRHRVMGLFPTRARKEFPVFTTSPSFVRGDFARTAAGLLDPRYDPEKQFYARVNRRLERFVRAYRNRIYRGASGAPVIEDIGRVWREERNIRKDIEKSVSVWTEGEAAKEDNRST